MEKKSTIPDFPTLPDFGQMITQACEVVASVRGIPYDFNGTLSLENKFVVLFKTVKEMFDAQDELVTSYKALHDFINQFFTNLDLQTEVNKKIEEMKDSGELLNLLKPTVSNEVSTWLTSNITNPSNPPIDKSLTVENAAADAKITGDKVYKLIDDVENIDNIVFNDKIHKLTFTPEGTSNSINLSKNTITSTNAVKSEYKAFINNALFESGKKYIIVLKFTNNSSTNISVYANAFSYKFEGSIGSIQNLNTSSSETSVKEYNATTDIRGFSIYSNSENASYTAEIYIYDITDRDITNIDFSSGGTKIKILKSTINKPYNGKILCTYGDSITEQETWQNYVKEELGFSKYYNYGFGGERLMALATEEYLSRITESFDVLLVMGGTNDWTQDRTIGSETDMNTDDQTFTGTFYGGLNALMKKLTTKYPTKRIVFMTQTPAKNSNGEDFYLKKGSADGLKNSNGNTTRDFAIATLTACGNNHIPCIDLNELVGWNENNISYYVKNENGTFFHPTSNGGKRMAECINGFLKTIKSIN